MSHVKESWRQVSAYVSRTAGHYKSKAYEAAAGSGKPADLSLFSFRSVEDCQNWIMGSDADVGGASKAYWGLSPSGKAGVFWGTLSTAVPSGSKLSQSGYAGIRSREGPLVGFTKRQFDVTNHRFLELRVKANGDARRQWFVNIQTDSIFQTYLWQHRLLLETPGEWETVRIPFRDFILTHHGYVQARQMVMDRSAIRTIGLSLARQNGDFSIEIDSLRAMNTANTLGDVDLLGEDEFMNEFGEIRKKK